MRVLEVLVPILTMLIIGMVCRKTEALTKSCIDGLKFLSTRVIIPVAVFDALATNNYDSGSLKMVGIMFIMLITSFLLGFLFKPFVKEPYKKYIPYMVSVYEGGMIGYPLFAKICGMENLSKIALLDIASLLFGFSIYMNMLTLTESGEKFNFKKMVKSALSTPLFVACILGVVAGLTGVIKELNTTAFAGTYNGVVDMISAPLSSIILIAVGYEVKPSFDMVIPCLQTIFFRVILQAAMIAAVLYAAHYFVGSDKIMDTAIILFMASPATFSMQTFLKTKEAGAYASTVNSLYCFISIAVYAGVAAILWT